MPANLKEIIMKQGIHPDYHDVSVTCSCGNQFVTKSAMAKEAINIAVGGIR